MSNSYVTLWTAAHQAPLSMGFSRQELEWVAMLFSRGSSQPRNQTQVSYIAGKFFSTAPLGKQLKKWSNKVPFVFITNPFEKHLSSCE